MGMEPNRSNLIKLLQSANSEVDYETETALITNGVLDSLSFVMAFTKITEGFDIEIPFENVTPENFDSVESMLKLIENLLASKA